MEPKIPRSDPRADRGFHKVCRKVGPLRGSVLYSLSLSHSLSHSHSVSLSISLYICYMYTHIKFYDDSHSCSYTACWCAYLFRITHTIIVSVASLWDSRTGPNLARRCHAADSSWLVVILVEYIDVGMTRSNQYFVLGRCPNYNYSTIYPKPYSKY